MMMDMTKTAGQTQLPGLQSVSSLYLFKRRDTGWWDYLCSTPMTSQSRGWAPKKLLFPGNFVYPSILTSTPTGAGAVWSRRWRQQSVLLMFPRRASVSWFTVYVVFPLILGSNFNPIFALCCLPFQFWPSEFCTILQLVSWHTPDFAVPSGWRHEWV